MHNLCSLAVLKSHILAHGVGKSSGFNRFRPLKERIVREVGYGLSLEGASAADLVKSMQAKSEPVAQKGKVA
jgi:hypothetical protein